PFKGRSLLRCSFGKASFKEALFRGPFLERLSLCPLMGGSILMYFYGKLYFEVLLREDLY
ncbi:hypothetical protein BpHYR1_030669, partial [Brachionus plicatilis]